MRVETYELSMPRVNQYNRQVALDSAVRLFWARGYHATSLKQLEQALDMRPGSLYAAFGSKQQLFLEALDVYAEQLTEQLTRHLAQQSSPLLAFKQFLREVVVGGDEDTAPPAQACMLIKTLMEATEAEAPLREKVCSLLASMETYFESLLLAAQRSGALAADVDCRRLARLVEVQIIGLRSYAERPLDPAILEVLVEDVCRLLDLHCQPQQIP